MRKAACREFTQFAAGPGHLPRRSRVRAARGHRPVSDRKTGFIEHGPGEPDRRAVGARSNDRNGAEFGRGAGGAAATPGRGSAATTAAPFAQRDGAVLGSARAVTSGAEGVAAPDWAETAHRRRNGSAERNEGRPSGTVCGRITKDVRRSAPAWFAERAERAMALRAKRRGEGEGSVARERPTGAVDGGQGKH